MGVALLAAGIGAAWHLTTPLAGQPAVIHDLVELASRSVWFERTQRLPRRATRRRSNQFA